MVQVQRQEEPEEEEEMLQAKPPVGQITPLVQRQVEPEEGEEELQAKATSGRISEANPNLESRIQSLKGGGQPLSENDRAFFEPRFGRDFSQVRVHTDTQAAESVRVVNARAFTMDGDVVFGEGQYAPGESEGRSLMAHELTHVVQQQNLNKSHLFPLSVLPDWLPNWAASANHAFMEFDDGWSAGFTMLEGESKEDARISSPEVVNTSEPLIDSKYQVR